MANEVINVITVTASEGLEAAVDEKLEELAREFEVNGIRCSPRSVLKSFDHGEIEITSAWGPANAVQDYIVRNLGQIDPNIVVCNCFEEEFLQAVGARVAWLEVASVTEAADLSDLEFGSANDEERQKRVSSAQEDCLEQALTQRDRSLARAREEIGW
jgi:hypothetical protein